MSNHDLFSFIKIGVRAAGTILFGFAVINGSHVFIWSSIVVMVGAEVFGVLEEIL